MVMGHNEGPIKTYGRILRKIREFAVESMREEAEQLQEDLDTMAKFKQKEPVGIKAKAMQQREQTLEYWMAASRVLDVIRATIVFESPAV